MRDDKISPFDSFTEVYKVLSWTGYFKILNKPKNRFLWICHQMYRCLAFMLTFLFTLAHFIFIIQRRHNWDDVFDVSTIAIPQLNLLMKIIALNMNTSRIDKINELLNDPILAAYTKKDEEMLLETKKRMRRGVLFSKISVIILGFVWPASFIVRRYQDPTAIVAVYTPFATDTWTRFICSVILEVGPLPWIGTGHLALDLLVSTYYAQAEVQLKIIKYNLEHLFDTDGASSSVYRDVADTALRNRFVHYVQRYEAVAWFTKEVGEVFNVAITFEFCSSTATICAVTYKMSSASISLPFLFMLMEMLLLLAQVLLYCYFGNLVKYESDSVITAVYLSDWMSASPELCRLLRIAMLRWSQTITPRVSGIIPLSLTTFVSMQDYENECKIMKNYATKEAEQRAAGDEITGKTKTFIHRIWLSDLPTVYMLF